MSARSVSVSACLLLACACARPSGWFRADKTPTQEAAYDERFEPIVLSPDGPCDPVNARQGEADKPIVVLVPGIGGDGDEMHQTLPLIMGLHPASVFMFRYGAFEERDALAERLAAGISRLAECIDHGAGRMLVLAHSAGGVLSSLAAARVKPPAGVSGDWLTILTVASPLNGTTGMGPFGNVETSPLMRVLGMKAAPYPAAQPGVRVVHLRTSAKSDGYMRPSGEHIPNDTKVGVPGAAQIDLPEELDHPKSLVWVARKIADGTWREWLGP